MQIPSKDCLKKCKFYQESVSIVKKSTQRDQIVAKNTICQKITKNRILHQKISKNCILQLQNEFFAVPKWL